MTKASTKTNTLSNMMTKIKTFREEIETVFIGAIALAIIVGLLYFFPFLVMVAVGVVVTLIASYILGYAALDGIRNIYGGGK